MKQQKHSGAAHLVIVTILLAIGLVGAVGYVAWDKLVNEKQDVSNVQEDTKVADNDDSQDVADKEVDSYEGWKIVTETSTGKAMSLRYPANWSIDKNIYTSEPNSKHENIILKSPDNKVQVIFNANLIGVGGTCDFSESNNKIVNLKSYKLSDFISGYSFYEIITNNNGYYRLYTRVIENKNIDNIKVGDHGCYVGIGIFKLDSANSLRIEFQELQDNYDKKYSLEEVQSMIKTDYYIIATKIIQSLYFK